MAILAQISMDCERLLARCFENYYSLSESAASGVLEGGQAATQIPAPALKPAVNLCSMLPPLPSALISCSWPVNWPYFANHFQAHRPRSAFMKYKEQAFEGMVEQSELCCLLTSGHVPRSTSGCMTLVPPAA